MKFIDNYISLFIEQTNNKIIPIVSANIKKMIIFFENEENYYFINTINRLEKKEKKEILYFFLKNFHLSKYLNIFLLIFINNRSIYILKILNRLYYYFISRGKTVYIDIISALKLNSKQLNKITLTIKKYMHLNVKSNLIIDPSIIGGIKVIGYNFSFDTSIATKLNEISKGVSKYDN